MSNYENINTGAIFKNDKKEKETHPDYKGSINVDGKDFYVSSWINTIKKGENAGNKYMSLKLTPKEEVRNEAVNSMNNEEPPF